MQINYDIIEFNKQMDDELLINRPRKVTFKNLNVAITINILDGNYLGVIETVVERGGIWGKDDDSNEYLFLPWPCAVVTISN